jgi:TolB protein
MPSPAAVRIAFVSNRDGSPDVFVMNEDGSGQTNLSQDLINNDREPSWAPDGRRVAFASSNAAESPDLDRTSIQVVQVDQGEITTLTTQSGHPVWSPGGDRLAVHGPGDHIFIIDAGTGEGSQITTGNGYNPAWSPDGRQVVFDDRSDLYLINSDGSGLTRLTGSAADEIEPAWSPDGGRIAFVSNGEGNNEIYVINVGDSQALRLTHDPGDDRSPAWSPDGQQIYFASNRDGNWEIYVMNVDGSNPQNLSRHPAADEQPAAR